VDARRARSEGVPSVSGSANSRGAKSASRRVAAARANSTSASTPSSGRSATSADQLIVVRSRRSASSGGVALRDTSLAAYIRNVKKVATLCDEALERLKTNFQQIPEEVTAIHNKIGGVLKLVDDMKGLPGSQQIMKGRVSDEMFRELRGTERNIETYNQVPLSAIAGILSGWLWTAEEDKSPARMKLMQLVETCESLVTIEEILTSQMQVLNWDVVDAMEPPVEQIILSPEQVKIGTERLGNQPVDSSTFCFCCSSEPIPVLEPKGRRAGTSPKADAGAGSRSNRL